MAGAKELKKRIQSVKNTTKITRTMEMVATAKSKRMMDRVNAAKPYGEKVGELMDVLAGLKDQVDSPLLRAVETPKKVAVLVVTANRGLCGGYNSNTLKLARKHIEAYQKDGVDVQVHMVGKKGISFFRFVKIDMAQTYTNIDDKMEYGDAEALANFFMKEFSNGAIDRLDIVSTIYHNSARQAPGITRVLPVGAAIDEGGDEESKGSETSGRKSDKPETTTGGLKANVVYEPNPEIILKKLLPLVVKTMVYRALMEAVTSEQIARRVAMKSASDNASEMNKMLKRHYNRIRQASITQELSEIVAGADAIG